MRSAISRPRDSGVRPGVRGPAGCRRRLKKPELRCAAQLAPILMAAWLPGVPSPALAAQSSQEVALLTGETGIDPEPGTLLATTAQLSIEHATLSEALVRLAEGSGVQIAFSASLLPPERRVDCECAAENVARALDRLLSGTGLGYVELRSQVVIVPTERQVAPTPAGTVTGRVRSEVAVPVENATVRLVLAADTTAQRITGTDRLGFFAFRDVRPGDYRLAVARIGYRRNEEPVDVEPRADVRLEITLAEQAIELEGVVVEARQSRQRARFEESAGVTVHEMDRAELRSIPGLAEPDPVRSIQALPGVTQVSDLTATFNVRGGSGDQNLVLLDGIPVFHPFHLMGLFSVFNADMVQRMELRSGGFPAEYGGRTSSVLAMESTAGDGELGVEAGVSLLASRLAVSGGLPGGATDGLGLASARWKVSGRRSYVDVVTRPFLAAPFPYRLHDYNGVFEGWTRGGDRVRVSAYSGRDAFNLTHLGILTEDTSDPVDWRPDIMWLWGNDAAGASWTRPLAGGGALDVRGSLSRFDASFEFTEFDGNRIATRISQSSLAADLERRPTPRTRWKSGLMVNRMQYRNLSEGVPEGFKSGVGVGWGSAAHTQIHWTPGVPWLVEAGVRLDRWQPGDGGAMTTVSPRIAAKRFLGNGTWAVRGSVGRYTQFLHSLRDEEVPIGLDLWVLSGRSVPAVVSDQLQAGVEMFVGATGEWFVSLEGYHRNFDGIITQNWAENPSNLDDDLITGTGRSYGADLMVRRDRGETMGWVSVSFLKAHRTFLDTGSGLDPAPIVEYPPVFDRRLEVDLVVRRQLRWGVEAGLRWTLGTGLPYTRPLATYDLYRQQMIDLLVEDTYASGMLLGPRNGERYPANHRLDVSFRKVLEKSWGQVTPYLQVFNVYNQKNVLYYNYHFRTNPPLRDGKSMMPFLPTIGVEVTF